MPTEPVENRIWLKLLIVKKIATGEAHPIYGWSDLAKVKQKQK
jgi:hypothetical protein